MQNRDLFLSGNVDNCTEMIIIINMEKKKRDYGAKKIAVLSLLTALGLIAFLIESLFPPLFFPGAKMGLSNIFSLFTLVVYGLPEALLVVTARTVLGSLFAGNVSLLLYSFTAGIASTLVSGALLLAFPKISLLCVSVLSAVVHNTVQLLVYCALTQTTLIFGYLPYLALLGVLAGVIVGLAVTYAVKGIPLVFFSKITGGKKSEKNQGMED